MDEIGILPPPARGRGPRSGRGPMESAAIPDDRTRKYKLSDICTEHTLAENSASKTQARQ